MYRQPVTWSIGLVVFVLGSNRFFGSSCMSEPRVSSAPVYEVPFIVASARLSRAQQYPPYRGTCGSKIAWLRLESIFSGELNDTECFILKSGHLSTSTATSHLTAIRTEFMLARLTSLSSRISVGWRSLGGKRWWQQQSWLGVSKAVCGSIYCLFQPDIAQTHLSNFLNLLPISHQSSWLIARARFGYEHVVPEIKGRPCRIVTNADSWHVMFLCGID